MHFSPMHTFKNLVKHKRSSTCFCGTEQGGKQGKGENNFKKKKTTMNVLARYMNVRMDLVQSLETVQLKSLKADLEKSAVRIMLGDPLLTCQGTAESRHCLFTLICQGCARVLTKAPSSLHLPPAHPLTVPSAPQPCPLPDLY